MSYKNAIRLKCIDCIHDNLAPGTALEQVADCPCFSCPLFPVRPLPRHCRKGGMIIEGAVATISAKLRAIDQRRAREGR